MTHFNTSHWVERDDHQPGYVYLMQAEGYHGVIPGCVLKRCKIGLSRNPELRVQNFHANQPPCNIRIIRTIYVEDMATVEDALHAQFKHCNVKLVKSREWFDISPIDLVRVHWAFTQHETRVWTFADIPKRAVAGGLVALLGVGLLIGYGLRESTTPQMQQRIERK